MAAKTGLPLRRPALHSHSSQLQFVTSSLWEIILLPSVFIVGLNELSEVVQSTLEDFRLQ